jgi:drug/metabolite transporter (DMT)-like permease
MSLHASSGRWQLGLALALVTAACWSTLPVALKLTLEQVDAITLTWFRFLVASLLMGAWLAWKGRLLASYRGLRPKHWGMLALAGLMLLGNYVFYLLGVQFTTPANAQLLIQLAPLLMALGGIFVFRERFGGGQWAGLAMIVAGLLMFFREQQAGHGESYALGAALVVLAAVVWAVYALLQKQLLVRLSSPAILWAVYVLSALLLWPFAAPSVLLRLDALHAGLLAYCALNTLVAYGAFAEALAHWEASRVSAILAATPILCVGAVALTHALWPELIAPERLGALGWAGALLVLAGSATASLLAARRPVEVLPDDH